MAYNKSKHMEAAQKALHQGKVPQAIAEYQAILKHEPKDQVTLMTVGDLFVRQGETFQALEYFERLAQLFLADGFVAKAIAIYKKIAKLAPEENRPVERLAELYIQQGVLSEARPIYLQLAEMHQRAGRNPQAAALLRKLLEAEPDNLRVLTQLADLLSSMHLPAEAAETLRNAAEQLQRRGDHAEAVKHLDRALQQEPDNESAISMKAHSLSAAGQRRDAIALLEPLPQLPKGGKAADQLLDLYLEEGDHDAAAALANKIFAQNPKHFGPALRVAQSLLEAGDADASLVWLGLIRSAMTDAGEHETLANSLQQAAERLPLQMEPREWLVELYGHTSNSFRMPDALFDLATVCEALGRNDRAQNAYEQLLDRDPENEIARHKLADLKARTRGGVATRQTEEKAPEATSQTFAAAESAPEEPQFSEPPLDEETQQFVNQSLTDVDLFSSYGLTLKAIDLLEVVLQRAPRHTPSIERLLDFYLGLGNENRTVELAAQLEQIYTERGDAATAERFGELRRRYERAGGIGTPTPAAPPTDLPTEFAVPMVDAAPIEDTEGILEAVPVQAAASSTEAAAEPEVHEVDLSEEWAALSGILEDSEDVAPSEQPAAVPTTQETHPVPAPVAAEAQASMVEAPAAEISTPEPAPAPPVAFEVPAADAEAPEFAVDLDAPEPVGAPPASTGDSFLRSLNDDLESALNSLKTPAAIPEVKAEQPAATPIAAAQAQTQVRPAQGAPSSVKGPGPLSDLFDQFRSEMGELSTEHEDLETHYNLGIAYREMGLLEEAISEFQKVAKANNGGQTFRYAMQCCTLLGLAFMEKGEPAIAAMWYERALEMPGLDQESILALRYDLGVAQELAGETSAARKSFSQVYGMNIDYRDVAERLSALGKGS